MIKEIGKPPLTSTEAGGGAWLITRLPASGL
jgi:hypothetical protein